MYTYTFSLEASNPLIQSIEVTLGGKNVASLGMSNPMHRGFNLDRLQKWLPYSGISELLYRHNPVSLVVEEQIRF